MGTVDLNRLPTFLAVAETGSFSAAAARLRMPKSSVSRQIAALERELGLALFHRTTRRVALSTEGASLRDRVAPSLASLQASVGAIGELEEEPAGRLRVTAPVDLGVAVLAPIVARFAARYPKIELELAFGSTVVDLVGEGFDVALRIAMRPLRDSALVAVRAAPIEIKLYASPRYLARAGTPSALEELAAHRWIAFGGQPLLRLTSGGRTATVRAPVAIRCDDMTVQRELLRCDGGIGVLPTFLADADVLAGALVGVMPRWSTPTGALWIVRHGGAHVPRRVHAFEAFVRGALRRAGPE